MRYSLKNRELETILLRDELNMIETYLFLQKSRFLNNLNYEIKVDEKYFHYSIAPMALQMLVENALKHNVISESKPLHVKVYIENDNLIIENNLQKKYDESSTGLGLTNIISRYKFLTYKEVKIEQNNKIFKVSLPLLIIEN